MDGFEIYKFNNPEKYTTIESNYMSRIVFEIYPAILNGWYDKAECDVFYSFIREYCWALVKLRKTKCKPSILVCLAYTIESDKKIIKSTVEIMYIRMITGSFKNWFFNVYKMPKRMHWFSRIFYVFHELIFSKRDKEYIAVVNEIKGGGYPDVLLRYDRVTFNVFKKTGRLKN